MKKFAKQIKRMVNGYAKDRLLHLISEKQAKNKKIINRKRNKKARRARAKNR